MIKPPFIFGEPVDGINFIDRDPELKHLTDNFRKGINSIIISPRKLGKTSLIKKASSLVKKDGNIKIVYLDMFSCRNETDFYREFANSVITQCLSDTNDRLEFSRSFLSRLAPQINLGTDSSETSLSFAVKPLRKNMEDILVLPEKIAMIKDFRIVVCIDEFQQTGDFPDSWNFQKELRSLWNQRENVTYCLAGCKTTLMHQMFENRKSPLYSFGDVSDLSRINDKNWVDYITQRFKITSKYIYEEHAARICNLVEHYSSYVQQLAWLVWINTEGFTSEEVIEESYEELIRHCSPLFQQQTMNLTSYQMNFLKSIVAGYGESVSGQDTIAKFELGSSANVCRIKESLTRQELIESMGKKVVIPDPVFREWIKRQLLHT